MTKSTRPFVLIDSNVLLDIFEDDPVWYMWSRTTLNTYAATHRLCINAVIYSEVSVGFQSFSELDVILHQTGVKLLQLPREALFDAGKVFLQYRKRGGARTSTLPDFFIGAHAAAEGLPLITRDTKRYQTYYPKLELVSPA